MESWPDFIKRSTQTAERLAQKFNVECWLTHYFRCKWRWAMRIANQDVERWSSMASRWDPQIHDERPCQRNQARPRKRWEDDINTLLKLIAKEPENDDLSKDASWQQCATNQELWMEYEDRYIEDMIHQVSQSAGRHAETTVNCQAGSGDALAQPL